MDENYAPKFNEKVLLYLYKDKKGKGHPMTFSCC